MKSIRKVTAILLMMCMVIPMGITTYASNTPSSWAADQVNAAITQGLVPQNMQSNYTQPATRAEFCTLAVLVYEKLIGEIAGRISFTDTYDVNIQKAAFVGIAGGVGDNRFNPDGTLTREQAAVMLSNLANALGQPFMQNAPTFADNDNAESWALDSIGRIQAAGIMGGTGNNMFSPKQPYTREQSIITVMRVYDIIKANNLELSGGTPLYSNTLLPTDDEESLELSGGTPLYSPAPLFTGVELTFQQARLDPDFGMFIPVNILTGFNFIHAHKVSDEPKYLSVVFHNETGSVNWQAMKPTEHDYTRIVSITDRNQYDMSLYTIPLYLSVTEELREIVMNPVFRYNDLSLDAIQARAIQVRGRRSNGDENNTSVLQMNFSVLYNDVIINLSTRGVLPEQVWEMLSELN